MSSDRTAASWPATTDSVSSAAAPSPSAGAGPRRSPPTSSASPPPPSASSSRGAGAPKSSARSLKPAGASSSSLTRGRRSAAGLRRGWADFWVSARSVAPRALLWPLLGPRSPPARPALRPELSALSLVVLWGEMKRQLSALSGGEVPLFLSLFLRGSGVRGARTWRDENQRCRADSRGR